MTHVIQLNIFYKYQSKSETFLNQETLLVVKVWEITSERHFINPSPLFEFCRESE